MAQAARDGSVASLSEKLSSENGVADAAKVTLLLQRGRRYIYEKMYDKSIQDLVAVDTLS